MLARFFVDRPVFATVLSLIIVIIGGVALQGLPIAQYPDVSPPTISIVAIYPGASAQVVADTVAAPIELQVNGVENMLYMRSSCTNDGMATIDVTFKLGTDIDFAQVLTQNRVAIAESSLPEEVRRQGVTVKKRSPSILMAVNLVSPDGSFDQLYISNYATTQVRDALARIPGVGDVTSLGARDYSMRIWLDPRRLASLGISASTVVDALRSQNIQIAGGRLGQQPAPAGQDFELAVNTRGRLREPEDFGEVIIKSGSSRDLVRLRDVARIELGAKNYDVGSFLDGKPATTLGIFQLPGSNALSTAEAVRKEMKLLSRRFPKGLEHKIVYDTTIFIDESIHEVYKTLIEAFVLVFVVVLLFLQDWRATLLPMIDVPVSLIGTFAVMAAMGFSLNNLSLFGLVLAIGIVVDDAIVVVENIETWMHRGLPVREATLKAMDEIIGPVIAITLVLSCVFIPTAFIAGISGQFYRQFALTIATATIISAINAMTMAPARAASIFKTNDAHGTGGHVREPLPRFGYALILAGLTYVYAITPLAGLMKIDVPGGAHSTSSHATADEHDSSTTTTAAGKLAAAAGDANARKSPEASGEHHDDEHQSDDSAEVASEPQFATNYWILVAAACITAAIIGWLGFGLFNAVLLGFFTVFNAVFDRAANFYGATVSRLLRVSLLLLLLYGGLLYLTAEGFRIVPGGFIPEQDKGYLVVFVQLPDGASLERTERVVQQLEQICAEDPAAAHTLSLPGYSIVNGVNLPNSGGMFVVLKPFHDRVGKPELGAAATAGRLRAKFAGIREAQALAFGAPPVDGLGNTGGFKLYIQDREAEGSVALQNAVYGVAAAANAQPGLVGVFSSFSASQPQVYVEIDRTKAQALGVSIAEVNNTMQTYLASAYVNDFTRFGRNWQVSVQADSKYRIRESDIGNLQVKNSRGQMVQLGTLIDVKETTGPAVVYRYNLYPAAEINGNARPGSSSGDAIRVMEQLVSPEGGQIPQSMGFEWTELTLLQILAGNTAVFVFGLGSILVFLVLSAQYESWTLPLAIILIVPMCLSAAIGGVWLTGGDNNIFVQIGFVVLIGLAAKNAILIVEFAKQSQDAGLSRHDAIIAACKARLRPIIMTSAAFILGVLPLCLGKGAGAEMRQALGISVFSGMLGVTVFGLLFTPVFYDLVVRLFGRDEKPPHGRPPEPAAGHSPTGHSPSGHAVAGDLSADHAAALVVPAQAGVSGTSPAAVMSGASAASMATGVQSAKSTTAAPAAKQETPAATAKSTPPKKKGK